MAEQFDVFLSYQWDNQQTVRRVYNRLVDEHKLKVWMDVHEMTSGVLSQELANALQNSKVFVAFVTSKYAESKNCESEFAYANARDMKTVCVMLEKEDITDLGGIGFMIARLLRINAYKDAGFPDKGTGFRDMVQAIKDELDSSSDEDD